MMEARAGTQEAWRWQASAPAARQTIFVTEMSDDHKSERQKKIDEGAEVVPFGFARVIQKPEPVEPDPLLWEGDGA